MSEESIFRTIFNDLQQSGQETSPRGLKVKEIENYSYELGPYERMCNFTHRVLNVNYIKQEFLWYLKGDRYDLSIIEHAKMWQGLVNEDKTINSNYGQYIFGHYNQFDKVVEELKRDKDSRRAIMMILQPYHLIMETKDVPCTISISFRIRKNRLNMTVRMRSQDAVFGMGNDAPAFSFVQEMLLNALREFYPDLEMGNYHHSADSFHIYERHFKMLAQINAGGMFFPIKIPRISGPSEVKNLRHIQEYGFKEVPVPPRYEFSKWLLTQEESNAVQLPGNSD